MQNSQLVKNYSKINFWDISSQPSVSQHFICINSLNLYHEFSFYEIIVHIWENHNSLATVFTRCMSLFFPIRGAIKSWNFCSLSLVLLSQHILMFYMKVPYIEPFIIAHIQFYFYRELRGPCCRLAPSRSLFFSVSVFSPQNARLRLQKSIFWKFGNLWKTGWVGKRCREN